MEDIELAPLSVLVPMRKDCRYRRSLCSSDEVHQVKILLRATSEMLLQESTARYSVSQIAKAVVLDNDLQSWLDLNTPGWIPTWGFRKGFPDIVRCFLAIQFVSEVDLIAFTIRWS